ncbi:MAG: hypothetical protein SGJ04_10405 [Bacteroidota bacterium]|nr:hypothetical protein [Bacteroidota bacterium]
MYISDNSKLEAQFNWKPRKTMTDLVVETTEWLVANQASLTHILD